MHLLVHWHWHWHWHWHLKMLENMTPLGWVRNHYSTTSASSQAVSGRPRPPIIFNVDIYDDGMSHVHLLTKGERDIRANAHVPTVSKVYGFRSSIDKYDASVEDT